MTTKPLLYFEIAMLLMGVSAGPASFAGGGSKLMAAECSARELERRDCTLRLGSTRVVLHQNRWRVHTDQAMGVHDLPLVGAVKWERVRLSKWANRWVMELWLWDAPSGEAQVETLNWYVVEVDADRPEVRVHEVVSRRMTGDGRQPAAVIADPREKTQLVPRGERIEWHAGRRRGQF